MSSSCQTQAWCPNSSSESWSTELEAERGSPGAQQLLMSTLHSAAGWTPSWGRQVECAPVLLSQSETGYLAMLLWLLSTG